MNRAYPTMPALKTVHIWVWDFTQFFYLYKTKKYWKFELGILNSSGDTVAQKYIEHINGMLRLYLGVYKWAIFSYITLLGYCIQ